MGSKRVFEPDALSTPDRPWSHGISPAGRPLYISGQVATDATGTVRHPDDPEKQFDQAIRNVGHVLEAAGGTMADLTALTIYVTDMKGWQKQDIGRIRYDYFEQPYPCSTLIEVTGLAHPEYLVEIGAVAHIEE